MIRTAKKPQFKFIRAALVLFAVLAVLYIPLKIYIAKSEARAIPDGTKFSIFATGELVGYREPCG